MRPRIRPWPFLCPHLLTPATAHAAAFFHALSKLFSAWPGKRAFLLGKKEENLMLHLEDNQIMYFRGDDIPCMMIAVKLYNTIDFDAKKKFTEELVKMIKETTNIEINDVYVSFDEYPNWGKQGTLF